MIARILAPLVLSACMSQAGEPGLTTVSHQGAMPAETINMVRRAAGRSPVRESAGADRAARRHARDLARNGGRGHRGSDGSTHSQRLRAEGCGRGVENVAWGIPSSRQVISAWMDSPAHRHNLLWPEAAVYGMARAGDRWVLVLSEGC